MQNKFIGQLFNHFLGMINWKWVNMHDLIYARYPFQEEFLWVFNLTDKHHNFGNHLAFDFFLSLLRQAFEYVMAFPSKIVLTNHSFPRWTGSNTNNPNNDGNGQARSDRNNIVELGPPTYSEGNLQSFGPGPIYGKYGVNYPAHVVNSSFLGLSQQDLLHLAFNSPGK